MRTPGQRRRAAGDVDDTRNDPTLTALPAEPHAGSAEFRQIWQTRPVHAPGHRTKTGDGDVLLVPEEDQEVVLITAGPGSPAA